MEPTTLTPRSQQQRRGRGRRWIAVVLVWLLVGAIGNTGLTWLMIIYGRLLPERLHLTESYQPQPWPFPVPEDWPPLTSHVASAASWRAESGTIVSVPGGAAALRDLRDSEIPDPRWIMYTRIFGVPFRSLGCWDLYRVRDGRRDSLEQHGAFRVRFPNRDYRLPYHPLWPGFALNTLFYAGLAFGLSRGVRSIRRWRRSKRGRCRWCAYDLAGLAPNSPCPECGASRTVTDTLQNEPSEQA